MGGAVGTAASARQYIHHDVLKYSVRDKFVFKKLNFHHIS